MARIFHTRPRAVNPMLVLILGLLIFLGVHSVRIFADGWRLPGVDAQGRFALGGVRGKLVCAAVPRFEAISGWDLARREPKPAQRVAPAGSVYWLDELDATPDALGKLAAAGLWDKACEDAARRAEGFNRLSVAYW